MTVQPPAGELVRLLDWVPQGRLYTLHPHALGFDEPSLYVLHPTTWELLTPEVRIYLELGPTVGPLKRAQALVAACTRQAG